MEWKKDLIVKLHKMGNLKECNNYRGITLLCLPSKVFNRELLECLKEAADEKLREHRASFRQKRSCTDQLATLCILIEQCIEWNYSLYINFVNYQKAFDSLDCSFL